MKRGGSVYILTNRPRGVLYVGVSSELLGRVTEHRMKVFPDSFTARYNLDKLVYYEDFEFIEEAIAREKQLKGGSRAKKIALIEGFNPRWVDLYEVLIGG